MAVALVTGADGFLGRSLLPALLRARWEVLGVGLGAQGLVEGIRWISMDLAAGALEEHADAVVHLAAPPRDRLLREAGAATALAAMDGAVIAAATEARFAILVSSAAVYGDRAREGARFDERTAPAPRNAYGRAKLAQERRWRAALPAKQLLVARLFNLTGPGEPPTQAARAFADRLRAAVPGETVGVRQSASLRDFLDVRDAGGALAELVGAGAGGTVNVCSGVPVSVADLATRMVRASGLDIRLDLDGEGGESRSVGDPGELGRRVAWRPRRGLDDTLSAIWAEAASSAAGTS